MKRLEGKVAVITGKSCSPLLTTSVPSRPRSQLSQRRSNIARTPKFKAFAMGISSRSTRSLHETVFDLQPDEPRPASKLRPEHLPGRSTRLERPRCHNRVP